MALLATSARFRGFVDAPPAKLRELIVPEDREAFDNEYRAALDEAAETLSLDRLERFLEHWRRIAWSQHDMGHDRWRAMLGRAEHTLRTGEPAPGSRPWEEVKAELGL
ncbi:MAG: DUF6247 family protein [Pseudonocardiaceae bacterium]